MTYWQRRYDQIEQAAHDKSVAYYSALEKKYSRAQAEIDKEINAWYQRFAVNNKIDYTEACRLLNSDELDEFRWSVEDYIKAGEENDVDGRWMKELENASARHHVNRLEALKLSTTNSIEKAMGGMTDDVDKMLRDVYKSTYYKGCYEFQRGTGIGFELAKVNDRYLDAILKKPWCADGSNYSDKIWKNKTKLVNELDNELTRMALTGDAPGESIRRISKALHTSKNNAATLVMTEQAFFTSVAQQDAFKELGVGEFEVVATLDGLTCTTCGSHDSDHRPMSEFKPGITAPPYHPNCRCTTVPYFNDEFTTAGKRAARDEEGKTYYVPESTKYAEWKQAFVDGDKEDLQMIKPNDTIKDEESSEELQQIKQACEANNIKYIPVQKLLQPLTSDEIIERLAGGDMTKGSCSSLAFAYAGNKGGYNVLDYRGGESRNFFSLNSNILKIAQLPNVKSTIVEEFSDFKAAKELLDLMEDGKEYYFAPGSHAAIVKKIEGKYQYLELQSSKSGGNGWKNFTNDTLKERFGCKQSHTIRLLGKSKKYKVKTVSIEIDSLAKSNDYKILTGYINTAVGEQKKGLMGNVK